MLVPTSTHADGRPGFWTLLRYEDQYLVTALWGDVGPDSEQPEVPPMRLEEKRSDGSWAELRRTGRVGGAANGQSIATYTYAADGEPTSEYRFTA